MTVAPQSNRAGRTRRALAVAGAAAVLASSCCLLPLVLVLTGLSGAWLTHFRLLEPYSPFLTAVSVAALAVAWKPTFRPATDCATCGAPRRRSRILYKVLFWMTTGLALVLLFTPLLAPLFY